MWLKVIFLIFLFVSPPARAEWQLVSENFETTSDGFVHEVRFFLDPKSIRSSGKTRWVRQLMDRGKPNPDGTRSWVYEIQINCDEPRSRIVSMVGFAQPMAEGTPIRVIENRPWRDLSSNSMMAKVQKQICASNLNVPDQNNSESSWTYATRIAARIKANIVFIKQVDGNPEAEVTVRTSPDGTIVGRTLTKSSGVPDWDEAVLRAVDKTQVIPRDANGEVPQTLTFTFRPK